MFLLQCLIYQNLLFFPILADLINPYLRKPIEPSINNEFETSDYVFTFTTSIDLFSGDLLLIKFPSQYIGVPVVETTFLITLLKWNTDLKIWQNIQGATCQYIPSIAFKVTLPDLRADNYKLTIPGIVNPSAGGTGNFVLETRRNGAYLIDINLVDYNFAFGQVGIVQSPPDLTAITITQTFSGVNNINGYTISFTTTVIIPKDGKFTIDLSVLNFLNDFTFTSTMDGTMVNTNGIFTINEFTDDIPIGTYNVVVTSIKNPSYAGVPGSITLRCWKPFTNTILNQKKGVSLPVVNPGVLTVTLKSHYQFGSSQTISINDVVQYQIQFALVNQIEKEGAIKISWLSGGLSEGCIVYSGLYDQDEAHMVTCSVVGNYFLITNFKRVQPKTVILIKFQAQNPASGSMLNLQINTYQDTALTKLVDTYDQSTGLSLLTYPQLSFFSITFPTISHQRANQLGTWEANFYHSVAFIAGSQIIITFPNGFTLSGPSCTGVTSTSVTDTGVCSASGLSITHSLGASAGVFSTSANNKLTITNIRTPTTPGIYPISVDFLNGGLITGRMTYYLEVMGYLLSGISTFRLSQDQSTQTLIYFTFPALQDIPSSQFQADYTTTTSEIWVEFETANNQFSLDLGTGLADGAIFPCYGYLQLQPLEGNEEIKCTFVQPTSAPTPARIKVHHYRGLLNTQQFQLHLPNIQNPKCLNVLVTVDVLCPTAAHATIKILLTKNRQQYILYQNDIADIIFPAVLPNIVVKNPKNDNLVGGLPSQSSPKFVPTQINKESVMQIRYEPGVNKYLVTTDTNHMIIIFPQLPTTDPMAYIVNKKVTCFIGLSTVQTCYAYKEVGWIVILGITQNIPQVGALDTIFYLKNFINPFYAADPIGFVQLYTIRNVQQYERCIFQDLPNFTPGDTGKVTVSGRKYQANMIDVEYNWLFSFNDDIPAGGLISMIYAVNFYNVQQSNPKPIFYVKLGLQSTQTAFLQTDASQNTNIYTITNFQPYKAGTLISIRMTGVKNPPKPGLTNYFGIQSQTKELFTIGQKLDVDPKTMIASLAIGEIIFNYFTMTPDNGSPVGFIFPANYEISFYPTRTIPIYGQIVIIFPPNEFPDSTSFLNVPLRCYGKGVLKTFQSCTLDSTSNAITIVLDAELRIEAGMEPIIVQIPNVKNFAEDLNSGVVVVRTLYDAVVLDDSGTTETNRKATSALAAKLFDVSNYTLTFYPTTEGSLGTYEIKLIPTLNMTLQATLVIQFPIEFPYGLGGNVGCDIPILAKATNDPVQCSVDGRAIAISNQNAFVPNTDGFTVILKNIRNPNKGTYITGIRVYIMQSSKHAQEFVASLGPMTFTIAAPILYMPTLVITSNNTRDYADYTLSLSSVLASTFTMFQLNFQDGYQIAQLWSVKTLTNSLDGTTVNVEPVQNGFSFTGTYTVTTTSQWDIKIQQLPNPLDEGIPPGYPDVILYDEVSKLIKMKTYWNLMQPITPEFLHAGGLIVIGNDDPNYYIEAGTYTNEILLSISSAAVGTISISPDFDTSFSGILTVTSMEISSGETNGTFRIGVDTSISVLRVVIKFIHSSSEYIPVRPIYLWIQRYKNISISVSDVREIPAGGRSSMQTITMSYASFQTLTFSFYLLNNIPINSDVYPKTVSLSDGERVAQFWISCGKDTVGAIGSLMTTVVGQDKSTFLMSNRLRNFTVVNPDTIIPFIQKSSIVSVQLTQVILLVQASEQFTLYFCIGPPFMRNVTFQQIKDKIIPYDYFNYTFIFGEYVQQSDSYEYQLTIGDLEPATLYNLTAYVEDFSGNLANDVIRLQFNTTGYVNPFLATLNVQGDPNVSAPTNNSLQVTGISAAGTLHAIALKFPHYIYQNHFGADTSVIRNRLLETTTDTTTTDTTVQSNNTINVLESDPYVPEKSMYICKNINLNYLSVVCTRDNSTINQTRIDYYAQSDIIPPNGMQVARGENHEGIVVINHVEGIIQFDNLEKDSDYMIFIASEQNGTYSENVMAIKGTTRVLFVLNNIILKIGLMILFNMI